MPHTKIFVKGLIFLLQGRRTKEILSDPFQSLINNGLETRENEKCQEILYAKQNLIVLIQLNTLFKKKF